VSCTLPVLLTSYVQATGLPTVMLGPGASLASWPLVNFLMLTEAPVGRQFWSKTLDVSPGTGSPILASPCARCVASALTLTSMD